MTHRMAVLSVIHVLRLADFSKVVKVFVKCLRRIIVYSAWLFFFCFFFFNEVAQ